jgi:hypothetical protein
MNNGDKKLIGQRLSTRVATGIMFVELDYLPRHKNPDSAWIRNIYILLSFYTELLLKAIFVMTGDFENMTDLDQKLRKGGHNLKIVGQQIGKEKLSQFGIRDIQFKNREYLIETERGNFYVKDFNDIRYDFLDGSIRTLNGDEHELFQKQIEIMHKINEKLKLLVW